MFDLVADVRRYPEFLPWVVATRIKSDSETEMVADMLVGFNALREKFTSRVHKHAPDGDPGRIEVDYLDGPMKSLSNNWVFEDADNGAARSPSRSSSASATPCSRRSPGNISIARSARWWPRSKRGPSGFTGTRP
jgi:hypothetical protein